MDQINTVNWEGYAPLYSPWLRHWSHVKIIICLYTTKMSSIYRCSGLVWASTIEWVGTSFFIFFCKWSLTIYFYSLRNLRNWTFEICCCCCRRRRPSKAYLFSTGRIFFHFKYAYEKTCTCVGDEIFAKHHSWRDLATSRPDATDARGFSWATHARQQQQLQGVSFCVIITVRRRVVQERHTNV